MDNLEAMRLFFQTYPDHPEPAPKKSETLSRELATVVSRFRLSWSHYVLLVRARSPQAREFYEAEAQFYERTALSRNKAAMLRKGSTAKPEDAVTPEEEIKSPYVLEFLGLRDEYS